MKTHCLFRCVLWIASILTGLGLSWVAGCDGEPGDPGPARGAESIRCGTDGVRTAQFQYVFPTGDPLTQEGVRMKWFEYAPIYLVNNGMGGLDSRPAGATGQHIQCPGVTGLGGIMTAQGTRQVWDVFETYIIFSNGAASKPGGGCQAEMDYRTRTVPRGEIALVTGGGPLIAYTPPEYGVMGNFSVSEYNALQNQTTEAPALGITKTFKAVVQGGQLGQGYSNELNAFMAINLIDPNDYCRYSAPFSVSCIVKTARPVALSGVTFNCTVSTDTCWEGIPLQLRCLGDNMDQQTHVFRTEYFLPVDDQFPVSLAPSMIVYDRWTALPGADDVWNEEAYFIRLKPDWQLYCDPNGIDDPNRCFGKDPNLFEIVNRLDTSHPEFENFLIPERLLTVSIIPMATGDYLHLRLQKEDLSLLALVADRWLSSDKNCDLNDDGVVNLLDLYPSGTQAASAPPEPLGLLTESIPEPPSIQIDSVAEVLSNLEKTVALTPEKADTYSELFTFLYELMADPNE